MSKNVSKNLVKSLFVLVFSLIFVKNNHISKNTEFKTYEKALEEGLQTALTLI